MAKKPAGKMGKKEAEKLRLEKLEGRRARDRASRRRARNEAFRALSKPEQRVTIARDVLSALRRGVTIRPEKGTYVSADPAVGELTTRREQQRVPAPDDWDEEQRVDPLVDVSELFEALEEKGEACSACALGACFIAAVRRADALKLGDALPDEEFGFDGAAVFDYLEKYFSDVQLSAIESAFEVRLMSHWNSDSANKLCKRACGSFHHVYDPGKRMRAIMENIVENGGRFMPPAPKKCPEGPCWMCPRKEE